MVVVLNRCRVQASRLVRSTPPGSIPAHRPGAGVHVKAAATGVEGTATEGAAHVVLGLDGVALGGRVVEVPGGDRSPREDATSSDAEGGTTRPVWRESFFPCLIASWLGRQTRGER